MVDRPVPPCVLKHIEAFPVPEYCDTLHKMIQTLFNNRCDIMFYEIEKESKHRFYPNDFCDIVLKINKVEPLKMIWDILHEYGHHQSGPPVKTEDEYKLEREVLAWKFADEHLKLYPELEKHKDDYAKYRWYCLGSYGVYKS